MNIQLGPLWNLRPRVNFANHMSARRGQVWGPRVIPDAQFVFILSGRGQLELGPRSYTLSAGDCVFYGTDSPHRLTASESDPFTFASAHFSWSSDDGAPVHPLPCIHEVDPHALTNEPVTYLLQMEDGESARMPHHIRAQSLEPLFLKLAEEYSGEGLGAFACMRGILLQIVATVVRLHSAGTLRHPLFPRVEPAVSEIQRHPDRPWTVPQLASICGYHPTYFSALFRDVMGQSPKHFIVAERIRKAKQELALSLSVDDVAYDLGFSSTSYFCRSFKAATGLTPLQFRNQINQV